MTMLGKIPWNKGKKFPHSKEWEKKRLKAVRKSAEKRIYPRGYTRPKEHTQPMLDALKKKMSGNPEKYRQIAIKNLPKTTIGAANGNWRGGKTKEARDFRTQMSTKFTKWRKTILSRDGNKCKLCGSTESLQIHHLIPLSESRLTAFLGMNGVVLCHACHKKTSSYGSKSWGASFIEGGIGAPVVVGRTIPHKLQVYNTVGNYDWTEDKVLVIFVSDMGNEKFEHLVFVHEFVEANLVRARGVSNEAINAFDIEYERNRKEGDFTEPGDHPLAPYLKEHRTATKIERMLAEQLEVNWDEYEDAVNGL